MTATHVSGETPKYYLGTEVIQAPVLTFNKLPTDILKHEDGEILFRAKREECLSLGE